MTATMSDGSDALQRCGRVFLTGKQVVPAAWIQDTSTGGPDLRAAFAAGPVDSGLPRSHRGWHRDA